jgi:hypothetical protein
VDGRQYVLLEDVICRQNMQVQNHQQLFRDSVVSKLAAELVDGYDYPGDLLELYKKGDIVDDIEGMLQPYAVHAMQPEPCVAPAAPAAPTTTVIGTHLERIMGEQHVRLYVLGGAD